MNPSRLVNKFALVTGAGRGIGFAIAQRLADEGATVSICDISEAALEAARAADQRLSLHCADVGASVSVQELVRRVVQEGRGLDILVNNAGTAGPRCGLEEITDEQWENTLRINLTGAFFCARAVAPYMRRAGGGSIINISTSSARTGLPNRTPYVVSKVGLHGLTLNLARELGPYGIRCNAILPGAVSNTRGLGLVAARAAELGVAEREIEQDLLRFISMRSWIQPAEIAAMAAFLASPDALHISGQIIGVCGNVEWEA